MSRATVDIQARPLLPRLRADLLLPARLHGHRRRILVFLISWKLALIALSFSPVLVAIAYHYTTSRTRCCATCSRRWPTSRRSPRRTSSASTSSSRSRRSRPSRTSSSAAPRRCSRRACVANRQRAFYVPVLSFLPLLGRRRCCSSAGTWSSTARSRSPEFVALQPLPGDAVFPLRMLGMWIGEGQRATASGERIFQVIDEPEDDRATRPPRGELPRRARAASASRASRSATTRRGRCCTGSTSSSSPGRTVALIGHTARARRRSRR